MLFALRHYSLPIILAVAMHAALVLFLVRGLDWQPTSERIIKPRIVNATLLVLEAAQTKTQQQVQQVQPAPRPAPVEQTQPKPDKIDPRLLEDQRKRVEEKQAKQLALKKAETLRKDKAETAKRAREAAERQRAERTRAAAARAAKEKQQRLEALSTSSFSKAVTDEATERADGEQAQITQTYFQGIRSKIVANWSRPASARNGMQATLRVELVPTGEVAGVSLVQSSGDAAFDRSAEAAVRKAGRFDVPRESAIFERRFRRFNLQFNPEDLLR